MTWPQVRTDLVIVAAAVSAGIHGALVREHLAESAATGGGFVAATVLLALLTAALTYRPRSEAALAAAALVFGGLIVSYAFAVTTGVPVLQPDPEPVDALAVFTKAVELAGLVAAVAAIGSAPGRLPFRFTRPEGVRA
jgi:CHASE2 domain-containing sensor protein